MLLVDKTATQLIDCWPTEGSIGYYSLKKVRDKEVSELICIYRSIYKQITQIKYRVSDPGVARQKLNFWYEEIQKLTNREKPNNLHPLTAAINNKLKQQDLKFNEQDIFINIINAEINLLSRNFSKENSKEDLINYLENTIAQINLCIVKQDITSNYKENIKLIKDLSISTGIIEKIASFGADIRAQLSFIELQKANLEIEKRIEIFEDYAKLAQDLSKNITSSDPKWSDTLVLIYCENKLSHKLLKEIKRNKYDTVNQRIELPPLKYFFASLLI